MPDPTRLSRRVADLARCSRAQAEQLIEGGWVRVDGQVVETPQTMVDAETVEVDEAADPQATEPATLLLHKPAGASMEEAGAFAAPANRLDGDPSGIRLLQRHFAHLQPLMPLDRDASGLVVFSQDPRVARRIKEDGPRLEQEYLVEVKGETGPYTLSRLSRGMVIDGRTLPPCKVSWQNEVRLRFAIKDVHPGQLPRMCAQVGFEVIAIRRLRIGRIGLNKLPVGQWRYLPGDQRF